MPTPRSERPTPADERLAAVEREPDQDYEAYALRLVKEKLLNEVYLPGGSVRWDRVEKLADELGRIARDAQADHDHPRKRR